MDRKKQEHCQPVNRSDDEGDRREADCCGGPLADREGQLGGPAQQVKRRSTHPVDGEARDHHRSEGLPHERVHHCRPYPCCPAWVVPVSLSNRWRKIRKLQ